MPSLPSKNEISKNNLKRRKSDHDYPGGAGESWLQNRWRPMMAWIYMITCITDFILFPVIWSGAQAYFGYDLTPWQPLTLQGAGLFHLAMGGVIGITAWSRGKEKEANIFNGGVANPITAQQIYQQTMSNQLSSKRQNESLNNNSDNTTININRKTKEERLDVAKKRIQGEEIYQDFDQMPKID
ncbi:MAG: hypothetical protein N2235_03135 [Fischerella sp.]|nr:hypothetical protein [Fischerella sp.]